MLEVSGKFYCNFPFFNSLLVVSYPRQVVLNVAESVEGWDSRALARSFCPLRDFSNRRHKRATLDVPVIVNMNEQEQVVSRFAALLGTKSIMKDSVASSLVTSDPFATASRELLLCLSKSAESHEVICTLPSLDMRKVDDEMGSGPLPKVGEHRSTELLNTMTGAEKAVPQMAASVLNNAADASAQAAQVEQKAAQSLGSLTSWTKSSVVYASTAISKNVADSFSSLVDSRVRAWTLLLLRHSLTTGDSASRSRLLSMLSSIIKVHSAETAFKTIPLPESASGQPKEADVILPLLLEVEMQVSIQSKVDMVTLRAPGTISGE